jgi:hypothetical protein
MGMGLSINVCVFWPAKQAATDIVGWQTLVEARQRPQE